MKSPAFVGSNLPYVLSFKTLQVLISYILSRLCTILLNIMSLLFLVSVINWVVETALCVHSFTQYVFGTGQMRVAFSIYRHSNRLASSFRVRTISAAATAAAAAAAAASLSGDYQLS